MQPTAAPVVLVVDDDPHLRALIVELLERDFSVLECPSAEDALELIARDRPAVVLLDVRLPRMDGVAMLRRLRSTAATRTLPVLVLTGMDDVDLRIEALEAGATDFLAKPPDSRELVARVRTHLTHAAAWSTQVALYEHERHALLDVLSGVRPGPTAEDTAAALVTRLHDRDLVASAVLVGVAGGGDGTLLASAGLPADAAGEGAPLSGVLTRRLTECVQHGACTIPGEELDLLAADGTVAACAPLRHDDELVAVLVLGLSGRHADDPWQLGQLLAVDVAHVLNVIVGDLASLYGGDSRNLAAVERAIAGEGAYPVFQPIIDIASGTIVGYEALTRFSDGGAPRLRFAVAARRGRGVMLERQMLLCAVAHSPQLPQEKWLSLNVSPAMAGLLPEMSATLRTAQRPLVLELTEHDPIDDYEALQQTVASIDTDVQLSIDDAGSGYACLRHVLALQPAFVKLDLGWVQGIASDPSRQALVAGVQHFAGVVGARVIAEGVEHSGDLAVIADLGVELAQGFLLAQPQRIERLRAQAGAG